MSTGGFEFASGNLAKMLALPKYVLSLIVSWFIVRDRNRWVFGSGIGVGEGALAVAKQLQRDDTQARIVWLTENAAEAEEAAGQGFTAVQRRGWVGYWETLRAGTLVVTHGLGDVNRFGVYGGLVVQLWHGAPLKRLHLDTPTTTAVRGPAPVRALLRKMYLAGAQQVDLYVAGSITAAERLRSAFRVVPGKVRVLGDPRDDLIAIEARDSEAAVRTKAAVWELLGASERNAETTPLVLYAPTWRDGAVDPAVPSESEATLIREMLDTQGAELVIRSHPLGAGAYERVLGRRVHALPATIASDITPLLGAFDVLVTDYSSIALDFALFGRPIVWFAPDVAAYSSGRGLYEPLQVTSSGLAVETWGEALATLSRVLPGGLERTAAEARSRALAARFHAYPEGGAAARVLAEIRRLRLPAADLIQADAVLLESFYGRQVTCNPLAIDREIARRFPLLPRYWSVTSERQEVPEGAIPLLVGGREWILARRTARLLVVNDWLRFGFRRRRHQTVLQTWHGTMLKQLALGRPGVSVRTRLAIRRESRRWSLLLSQNPHSTDQFRRNYAYRGEILEVGYPRDDRLAQSVVGESRNPMIVHTARTELGVPHSSSVLVYAPTWRDRGITLVDELNVNRLAEELGEDWVVVVRGHTRTHAFGRYGGHPRVVDVSAHADVNDVILAADLIVTDYSSIMFDAAVAYVPQLFFVPDVAAFRDRERGFTFDFEREAPGPILSNRSEVVSHAQELRQYGPESGWMQEATPRLAAWRDRFTPHDDGHAAERVVDALLERGALPMTHAHGAAD